MPTLPYLHFQGNCAEALRDYARIFGSAPPQMMLYADAPGAPAAHKGQPHVIHGQVAIFDGTLMASDFPPGMEGDPQKAVSVMQSAPDMESGERIFNALCEGGAVIQPWGPSFFAKGFGMVKDRHGTHWILTVQDGPGA